MLALPNGPVCWWTSAAPSVVSCLGTGPSRGTSGVGATLLRLAPDLFSYALECRVDGRLSRRSRGGTRVGMKFGRAKSDRKGQHNKERRHRDPRSAAPVDCDRRRLMKVSPVSHGKPRCQQTLQLRHYLSHYLKCNRGPGGPIVQHNPSRIYSVRRARLQPLQPSDFSGPVSGLGPAVRGSALAVPGPAPAAPGPAPAAPAD